jgi:hypothetical protein
MDDKAQAAKVELLTKLTQAGRPEETLPNDLKQVLQTVLVPGAMEETALMHNVIPDLPSKNTDARQQQVTLKRTREQLVALQVEQTRERDDKNR